MLDFPRKGAGGRVAPRAVGGQSGAAAGSTPPRLPDPKLIERPERRRFTAEYKLQVLREADACTELGQIGALPRREGLYSSHLLSDWRRQREQAELHSERFVDCAPAAVWATLLDEGRYLCSERTMYRLLAAEDEVRERRDQLRHPVYSRPELLATGPNVVWSWDITKLLGPQKWSYYYLYVILGVNSRYVVAWTLQERESAAVAEQLIAHALSQQGVERGQLTIHADRGSAMTSKPVAFLLADLGVTRTHSRPYTSSDNPYSEAHFRRRSTGRTSPRTSEGSWRHGRSAASSSPGTTRSTGIVGSGC